MHFFESFLKKGVDGGVVHAYKNNTQRREVLEALRKEAGPRFQRMIFKIVDKMKKRYAGSVLVQNEKAT